MSRFGFLIVSIAVVLAGFAPGARGQLLTTERVASGLSAPLFVTSPPGDYDRLFIVEQNTARIRILKNGSLLAIPFLDIGALASQGGEQGLLGLAFHPDYANNGLFFVNYTDNAGSTVVARYQVSGDPDVADPGTASILLTIPQPYSNHNGGMIAFGPNDGYLYIGMGDGGSANDPGNRAQTPSTLLGKILRIDVDGGPPYGIPPDNPFVGISPYLPEIWAVGVRNPWRFSFDRKTGDLWIGDVGQNSWEEIDFQPAGSAGGENYGWRCMEATHCTGLTGCTCNAPELTLPIHEYSHAAGNCSVTGGYVYRGCELPEFDGVYFFADYCSGRIWTLEYDGVTPPTIVDRTVELDPPGTQSIGLLPSFGEDAAGNLYIVDIGDGEVYKIVRRPAPVEIQLLPSTHHVLPGEFLFYDIQVANQTGQSQPIVAWIDVIRPDLTPWPNNPLLGPKSRTLGPAVIKTKTAKLKIPANAPPSGPFFLRGSIGTFPDTYQSVSCFHFFVD